MNYELFAAGIIVFVWLFAAWSALRELSPGRVRRLETEDKELSRKLENWLEMQPELDIVFRFLLFLLLGFIAAALFYIFSGQYPEYSFLQITGMALIGILALLVICGIIVRIILGIADVFILRVTLPLIVVLRYSAFWPIVLLIRFSESGARSLAKQESDEEKTSAEDEIMSLVEHDDEDGGETSLEEDEKRMIRGIFDLDDTPVREIMTPRVDMTALPETAKIEDARRAIVESGHSRIPLYGESIDEIKGIIYAKDFLNDERRHSKLLDYSHKPVFIPETKNVGDLLEEFKLKKVHIAIIIDEYGGTSGIVSLEDILEEIVGEIRDEYDIDEETFDLAEQLSDGTIVTEGRTLISDLNEEFDLEIPEDEDVDTIGGYVCGEFGRIPEAGENITVEDIGSFEIMEADGRKITSLKITPPGEEK